MTTTPCARGALVMCAAVPWRLHRNRQQELAERLSAHLPVLYVEPPTRVGLSPAEAAGRLWAVGDQCHVLPSVRGLPGDRVCGPINGLVQKRLAGAVKRALSELGRECAFLWIDRIHSVALAPAFPEAQVIYDCVDEEWTFGRLSRRSYLQRLEAALLDRANLVIASSQGLQHRLSAGGRKVELVPNGCDFAHFSQPAGARPPDLPPPDRPVVGFIGTVSRRSFDLGLLSRVCRLLPDLHFAFIGSADATAARTLSQESNAVLLGARPYADLPDYLAAFEVAIIPYLVGRQIDYVYPKKLHEYLAAGKPVVATDLPELRPFREVVSIGHTPEEFAAKIAESLTENTEPASSARRAVAREHTWEARVAQILSLLDTEPGLHRPVPTPWQKRVLHA